MLGLLIYIFMQCRVSAAVVSENSSYHTTSSEKSQGITWEYSAHQSSSPFSGSRAISRKLRAVQTMDESAAAALLELDAEPGKPVAARLPENGEEL